MLIHTCIVTVKFDPCDKIYGEYCDEWLLPNENAGAG